MKSRIDKKEIELDGKRKLVYTINMPKVVFEPIEVDPDNVKRDIMEVNNKISDKKNELEALELKLEALESIQNGKY